MKIEKIYIYPIKSLRPYEVPEARIGRYGFQHDRTFMLAKVHRDEATNAVSKLENMHIAYFPKLALFLTALDLKPDASQGENPGDIVVTYTPPRQPSSRGSEPTGESNEALPASADPKDEIRVPLKPSVDGLETVELNMHKSPTVAYNMGATYNDWFASRLGHEVIFAYIGHHSRLVLGNVSPAAASTGKPVPAPVQNGPSQAQSVVSGLFSSVKSYLPSALTATVGGSGNGDAEDDNGEEVSEKIAFQDCAQFLLVTTPSLADVSSRLPEAQRPMDITKFRPNIVIAPSSPDEALEAWDEDYWGEVELSSPTDSSSSKSLSIVLTSNCARCQSINVDYATGNFGGDERGQVLKKLQKDRRVDEGAKYSPIFGRYGFVKEEGGRVGDVVGVGMEVRVSRRNGERGRFVWPGLGTDK